MTQHNPRPGESYGTRLLTRTATAAVHKVVGRNGPHPVRGTLVLKLVGGEHDGYDWHGTPMDEDQMQSVLDLFADG
jgi:hypothetical protein